MRQTLFFTAIVACYLIGEGPAHADNSALMAASFAPFKPKVRYYTDSTHFYEESDNMPDNSLMPNLMVGITSWQQQIPLPTSYFASVTNPESSTGSLGYGQPNYWRLPLSPVPSASPIAISSGNFQRGAVAIAANGIAIFNPKNNTGKVSYEIGELDAYGGHCGLADDYHYHIIPTHLLSAFGGVLSNDKPCAWALDGYPIYGYVEPDGTTRQTLDADGGHDIGNGWGCHYHAIGSHATD
ncbi:MAG: YHYH protein, partial [Verrucomicrobiota bacterium]